MISKILGLYNKYKEIVNYLIFGVLTTVVNLGVKYLLLFTVLEISTLLLEMFIMWFFVTFLKLNSHLYVIIFTLISQAAVITANYIFSKLFVFKKTEN